MDKFFNQRSCDRCGQSLRGGRIISAFNEDCICISCAENEKKDPDYDKARKAEHDEIKRGNYNYQGIRG